MKESGGETEIGAAGSKSACLAVDLGASSGRVIAGMLVDGIMTIREIARFENAGVRRHGSLYWDFEKLWDEIRVGLSVGIEQLREEGYERLTIGVDSWGVDFGLLDEAGELIEPPMHYRDERTHGMVEAVCGVVPAKRIFEITGIQFMPINTLYQLAALKKLRPEIVVRARHFLMISDLIHYRLTGVMVGEFTNASTTQCFDSTRSEWSREILDPLDIPIAIFPRVLDPGMNVGPLKQELVDEWGGQDIEVIAVATHDTGSAVVAVPARAGEKFAYLSCGTWSLLGVETAAPNTSDMAFDMNFTNEGGAGRRFRLLKNIMGLWLLQQCRREWDSEGLNLDWQELQKLAMAADDCEFVINVDDERFLHDGPMVRRIEQWCREHDMVAPSTPGQITRCILKSLAARYREVLEMLEKLTGDHIDMLYIVGGGVQNELLCQWTADACDREVMSGPIEATALGNIAVQFMARGEISSLDEIRHVIRESYGLVAYWPQD